MRSVVLGLVMLAVLGTSAFAKPKIAILGLEVVGNLDPEQVKLAKQLTTALRERASAGTGPYDLAANSDKELVDEKLMANCGTEALSCMAPIGAAMKADFLMYGKIEKVDRGYHVTIKLMRVATKLPLPTFSEIVPTSDVRNDPRGVAKRAYSMMTASDEGSVTIRVANVERATVYVNDQPMGTTSSGVLTFSLPEGRHRLAVVATEKGWRRHEEELAINAGDQRNIPVELSRAKRDSKKRDAEAKARAAKETGGLAPPGGSDLSHTQEGATSDDSGEGRTGWRVAFGTSLVVAIAGGATWAWGYQKIQAANRSHRDLCGELMPPVTGSDADCRTALSVFSPESPEGMRREQANEDGDRGEVLTIVGGVAAGVGVVVGAFAFYKGFIATPEKAAVGGIGGRRTGPRRNLIVSPVVSPSGGGATLRFDW